jgi:hypothetical protein
MGSYPKGTRVELQAAESGGPRDLPETQSGGAARNCRARYFGARHRAVTMYDNVLPLPAF